MRLKQCGPGGLATAPALRTVFAMNSYRADARLGNRLRWRRSTVETHLENVKPR